MAIQYRLLRDLIFPEGYTPVEIRRPGSGFSYVREDMRGVTDLGKLDELLGPLAPFDVRCNRHPSFSSALSAAAKCGDGEVISIWGNDGKCVCRVDLL